MNETYQNPEVPGSFGGVDALYRASQGKVSKKQIRKWLEGVDAYTLHKPVRKKFLRNRVIVYAIDQQWQSDLVDMGSLSVHNDGYRYILTCIDVLSKYSFAIALKTKRGEDIVNAFKIIFSKRKPQSLQTDQGKEFLNSKFQKFLKQNNVRFFTTYNTTKSSIIERYNKSLKSKMWKYFTAHNTFRYIDVLDELVSSYNHTFHRSIQLAPAEVTQENESDVFFTLYGDLENVKRKPCVFKPGEYVRISRAKLTFEKGYTSNFTEELFIIKECVQRHPPVYRIADLLNEPILGTFYAQELQRVQLKSNFKIEKILKKRKRKGMEYFVKFSGYPDKFNQWVSASNMISL